MITSRIFYYFVCPCGPSCHWFSRCGLAFVTTIGLYLKILLPALENGVFGELGGTSVDSDMAGDILYDFLYMQNRK